MQESLQEMGVSIFSGAITTFGSGFFLFGGKIIFFVKFAMIITSTVVIAVLYSMVFFMALCLAIGPQGETANLEVLKEKFRKKSKEAMERSYSISYRRESMRKV